MVVINKPLWCLSLSDPPFKPISELGFRSKKTQGNNSGELGLEKWHIVIFFKAYPRIMFFLFYFAILYECNDTSFVRFNFLLFFFSYKLPKLLELLCYNVQNKNFKMTFLQLSAWAFMRLVIFIIVNFS